MDEDEPTISPEGLRQQFQQQIDFFRQKLNLPSERWDDIKTAAHDRAFIVTGAQKADLLNDLRQAVDKSINGQSIGEFRKDFAAAVKKSGWSGWTGQGTKAGEAWRTRVTYQTNIATSYAAGRWQQFNASDLKAVRPFLRYIHADGVVHPRPMHKAWGDSRLTLPTDHPFWLTHLGPNGWGCGCTAKAVRLPSGTDATSPPDGWDELDPKTGAPVGIDKGWGYAPGRTWFPDLEKYPFELARDIVAANMRDGIFDRWLGKFDLAMTLERSKPAYVGMTQDQQVKAMRKLFSNNEKYPIAVLTDDWAKKLGVTQKIVSFSDYDAIKQAISRASQEAFTSSEYAGVQDLFDTVRLVIRDGKQSTVWFNDDKGQLRVAVLWQTASGEGLYLKSLRLGNPKELTKRAANGEVLYER